jgi:hypothetical protein
VPKNENATLISELLDCNANGKGNEGLVLEIVMVLRTTAAIKVRLHWRVFASGLKKLKYVLRQLLLTKESHQLQ